MPTPLAQKSTLEEIRARFDGDVERFSNLETGQQAAIDSLLILELVSQVAASGVSAPRSLLDIGCGAGNFTLKVLQRCPTLDCALADLSQPMLTRAEERVAAATTGRVSTYAGDMRRLPFAAASFDIILAGFALHHLREAEDWEAFFRRLHGWLRPGGMLFVADMMWFEEPTVQRLMWDSYGEYLTALKGPEYRDTVFAYIDKEDSPRSLPFQFGLLARCGFRDFDLLHRHSIVAAYYARK